MPTFGTFIIPGFHLNSNTYKGWRNYYHTATHDQSNSKRISLSVFQRDYRSGDYHNETRSHTDSAFVSTFFCQLFCSHLGHFMYCHTLIALLSTLCPSRRLPNPAAISTSRNGSCSYRSHPLCILVSALLFRQGRQGSVLHTLPAHRAVHGSLHQRISSSRSGS